MIERIKDGLFGRARWFDLIEVRGVGTPISYRNNRLHTITEHNNTGFGVRVNVNGKTGFSYTNDTARLDDTAEQALALAAYGDDEDFELPARAEKTFEPYDASIQTFDAGREAAGAEDAISEIRRKFPKATVDMSISGSTSSVRIVNSKGLDVAYRSSRYSVSLSATIILDDGTRIEASDSMSALAPVSHSDLRASVIHKIEAALTPGTLPSGRVPVVLSPRAFARIIGIVTAGLSAKSVWKGISPFGDKRGAVLFNKVLTVRDDPEIPDSPYSYPFDDEGVTAVNKHLINGGRIEKFITDLKHARTLCLVPEGNGSRGYSSLPYPSYSNILIEPGSDQRDAIIGGVARGVLVEEFIGLGQSNTLTGDFSANLELAYLIENGRLNGRVKDCMLTDNLFKLLAGDMVLSRERERSGSVVAPTVLFPAVNYTG
ncbi:MAG: hypothetical protein A2176_01820 [Spirochaetes bacterium RBG_13_51_14]|nr:MAG: hypothetical protein A2176_01820 [Spirochaetes bacterium RBG_13_51_14]